MVTRSRSNLDASLADTTHPVQLDALIDAIEDDMIPCRQCAATADGVTFAMPYTVSLPGKCHTAVSAKHDAQAVIIHLQKQLQFIGLWLK